jgi:hypothetical protein
MRGSQSPSGFCDDDGFAYQKPSRAKALTNTNNNAYQGDYMKRGTLKCSRLCPKIQQTQIALRKIQDLLTKNLLEPTPH